MDTAARVVGWVGRSRLASAVACGCAAVAGLGSPAAAAAVTQGPQWIAVEATEPRDWGGTFDARRRRVVRFDGASVWEGRDGHWQIVPTAAPPPASPVARVRYAMTFDSRRGRMVMFGGLATAPVADTWTWDGLEWRRLVTVVTPPRRVDAVLAFDSARDAVVLCGGGDFSASLLVPIVDSWELVNGQWAEITATPAYGAMPAMTYDAARGEVVVAGVGAFHYDGVAWRNGNPQVAALAGSAMTYDPRRRVVVLHRTSLPMLEYDGATWSSPGVGLPTTSQAPRLHFDPDRGQVVLSELYGTRRWTWDGARFDELPPGRPPRGPSATSFVDSSRGRVVVVGAERDQPARTWELDGLDWQRAPTPVTPTVAAGQSAAFDARRGRGIVFGAVGDVWSWDGAAWTRLPAGPPARVLGHVVYDALRDRLVVFGGLSGPNLTREVWEWDGATWTAVPATTPVMHVLAVAAFDPISGRTTVLDGHVSPAVTRQWDGAQWSVLPIASPPGGNAAMTLDPARNRVVLADFAGLWEFDGASWLQVSTAGVDVAAPARMHAHPTRGTLMLFDRGGIREFGAAAAAVRRVGEACGLPPAVLMADMLPRTGQAAFTLAAASVSAAPTFLALDVATATTPLGNGCSLQLPAPIVVRQAVADAGGLATLPLPIPAAPALQGLVVFAQAAALAAGQPGGFVTSQVLQLGIGQ